MIKHLALVGENLLKQMCITLIVLLVLYPSGSWAQKWVEPKKGTDTRKALMDAIRPHMEWHLGKPIQFVVEDLRVWENVGFGTLSAQTPGGAKIDLMKTPAVVSGYIDPDISDGTRVTILYKKVRKTWVAVHYEIGATDVWFSTPKVCDEYKSVIPEWCNF